jgi:hypothetical protein
MAREGTPQNFALRKASTKQYVATNIRILYMQILKLYWLKLINLRLTQSLETW